MVKQLPELERRRVATEKTFAKFQGKGFSWRDNRHCIALTVFQAKALRGEAPNMPRMRSALAAKREIKARGCETVTEVLDQQFQRIPPAMMLLGDICTVAGDEGLEAVFVNVAPGKAMGWREDEAALVVLDLPMHQMNAAWRL